MANTNHMIILALQVFIEHYLDGVRAVKGFKILYLNAQRLLANWDEFDEEFLTGHFKIFAATETWLHACVSDSHV